MTQAARIAGPGLAMVILAAGWQPALFGEFASRFALAGLLALAPAAGFSAYILDRGARQPEALRALLKQIGRAFAAFCCVLMLGLAAFAWAWSVSASLEIAPYLMMMGLAGGVDIVVAALRSRKRETTVASIVLPANAAILATALASFATDLGPAVVAWLWVAIRAAQLAAASVWAMQLLPGGSVPAPVLTTAGPFLASQSAGIVYSHLDTLLVRLLLGEAAAGIYNAALRLLHLAGAIGQTLAQWFQPRLAALAADSPAWLAQRQRLRLLLAAVAGGGLLGFLVLGQDIVQSLYGSAYAAAAPILDIAAFVLVARCFVAGQWIELTARRLEAHRARDAWLLMPMFVALAWPLAVWGGAQGVMVAHLLALGPIAALSGRSLARARHRSAERLKSWA